MEYVLKEKLEAEQFTSANYGNVKTLLEKHEVSNYEYNIRNGELKIFYKIKESGLALNVTAHIGDYVTFYRGSIWLFKKDVFEGNFKEAADEISNE